MITNSFILLNALPDKKTKSIGNRCMVELNNGYYILDYHIKFIKKIFKNPEIIIVGGFDTKKIKKYILSKYKNIIHLEHDIDDYTNIGKSIEIGLKAINGSTCLLLNSNNIIHEGVLHKIKNSLQHSFVINSNIKGDVGLIANTDLINCYYGLPKKIYDILYVDKNQIDILLSLKNITKLYFFEIINLCISNGMVIKPIEISKKNITIINNIKNIEKMKKNLCQQI